MNVPSLQFLGFAVGGALLFNLSGAIAWRRLVLLALNVTFFALFASDVIAVLPYIGFLLAGYCSILLLHAKPSRALFLLCLAVILFSFFCLKHYVFVPTAWSLSFVYMTIGLSYVFFRVVHLVIEVWQGSLTKPISLLSYINYTLHFPALISGPIQLYPAYHRMESEERLPLDIFVIGQATWRIALGFFKVLIVSTLLMQAQHHVISALVPNLPFQDRVFYSALSGSIYPFFLYANFSGYTDFVIGVARLYRFELPENFDNPFVSENFISFWSRWHITLSNWLKTYVYIPILVTGMRRMPSRRAEPYLGVFSYFITFFLVGAWHGQSSMFLFFGILQGGGVATNKLYQTIMTNLLSRKGYRELAAKPLYRALARGLTFSWFAFTLLWFWSSWHQLGVLIDAATFPAFVLGWLLVFAIASTGLAVVVALQAQVATYSWIDTRYARTVIVTGMMTIVVTTIAIAAGPAPDIVYKNF